MAISRPGGALPPKLPASYKQRLVARHMRDGSYIITGPMKKRGKGKTGGALYQQLMFAWTEKQTRILEPRMRITCEALAKGTKWTWRDIATMMILGIYYAIENPDGSIIQGARLTNPNPQFVLDLLTQVVGALAVRTPPGWVGLPPGAEGQRLGIAGGIPTWVDPTAAGSGYFGSANIPGSASSTLFATKGSLMLPMTAFSIRRVYCNGVFVVGATYKVGLYLLNSFTISQVIAVSPPVTFAASMNSMLFFDFGVDAALIAGQRYALAFTRTDATTTTSMGVVTAVNQAFGLPVAASSGALTIASTNPVVGAIFANAANQFHYGCAAKWN